MNRFTIILLTCLCLASCRSSTQKTPKNYSVKKNTITKPPVVSKVIFIDTTIGDKHITVSFLPVSTSKEVDSFLLYVGVNDCYDSVRTIYYGWDDTSRDDRMVIQCGKQQWFSSVLLADSLLILSVHFNVGGIQLLFATIGNNCVKWQHRNLKNDVPYIVFPDQHMIGEPEIRGLHAGRVDLIKYGQADTLHKYCTIDPHYDHETGYTIEVLHEIQKAYIKKPAPLPDLYK